MLWNEKLILVAGGSSGIGKEVSLRLASFGAKVLILSRKYPEWIAENKNISHEFWDAEDSSVFKNETLIEKLDGFVYCPGNINLKPFANLKINEYKNDFQINFLGVINLLQSFFPALKKAETSSIVLYSTVAVQTGISYHTSIASAKGALEGFTRSLAAEWSAHFIRVNAIALSLTDTPLSSRLISSDEKKKNAISRHPLKRIGDAGETADSTIYLLSDAASWMTGQILHLDGGISSIKPL